jgi:hypothetical protein
MTLLFCGSTSLESFTACLQGVVSYLTKTGHSTPPQALAATKTKTKRDFVPAGLVWLRKGQPENINRHIS